ncbi:MAG TPA: sigma-54 dependent transcriptional regulator [Tepidisphaeraceae bacterium]|nr:sigma-54 dependent transcriptional regulator [Tepidisphaeraceae bacterium]
MLTRFRQSEILVPEPSMPDVAFIGNSPAIQRFTAIAERVAALKSTVMILGETGTGKETFARLIHCQSRRSAHPFIPVDCTALPENLFESELFGHMKGSFTGAHRDSLGYVRSAHLGTLFLDEIGELSLGLQAKLLRVLQDRRVVPVGASSAQSVDIRVICATNCDLSAMVAAGTFRQDLFFRLAVVSLELPPLRERPEDIVPLAEHWLNTLANTYDETPRKLSPAVADALLRHSWPGNIRELYNVIEHAHVLCKGSIIELQDLPPRLNAPDPRSCGSSRYNLATVERQTITEALEHCNCNRTAACRLLGIELRRLNRRMASLKIDLPRRIPTGRPLEPLAPSCDISSH